MSQLKDPHTSFQNQISGNKEAHWPSKSSPTTGMEEAIPINMGCTQYAYSETYRNRGICRDNAHSGAHNMSEIGRKPILLFDVMSRKNDDQEN